MIVATEEPEQILSQEAQGRGGGLFRLRGVGRSLKDLLCRNGAPLDFLSVFKGKSSGYKALS